MSQFQRLFGKWVSPSLQKYFGEDVIYLPRGVAEDAREIVGKVDRTPAATFPEFQHLTGYVWVVRLEADATRGITAEEIDTGTDILKVKMSVDAETYREFRIVAVRPPSGGMTRVLIA